MFKRKLAVNLYKLYYIYIIYFSLIYLYVGESRAQRDNVRGKLLLVPREVPHPELADTCIALIVPLVQHCIYIYN